ncbi:MAG: hypothetical protein H6559_18935 [Lewinellaceae bacterium]|nr:hypothetical protein [Lewinellaceae bacterium]
MGMDPAVVEVANESVAKALKYMGNTTAREQEYLIRTIARRYPPEPVEDRSEYDEAYIEGMRQARRQFPDDDDIAAMLVIGHYGRPSLGPVVLRGRAAPLDAGNPGNPGGYPTAQPYHVLAIHLYIHATEASQAPELAIWYMRRACPN